MWSVFSGLEAVLVDSGVRSLPRCHQRPDQWSNRLWSSVQDSHKPKQNQKNFNIFTAIWCICVWLGHVSSKFYAMLTSSIIFSYLLAVFTHWDQSLNQTRDSDVLLTVNIRSAARERSAASTWPRPPGSWQHPCHPNTWAMTRILTCYGGWDSHHGDTCIVSWY